MYDGYLQEHSLGGQRLQSAPPSASNNPFHQYPPESSNPFDQHTSMTSFPFTSRHETSLSPFRPDPPPLMSGYDMQQHLQSLAASSPYAHQHPTLFTPILDPPPNSPYQGQSTTTMSPPLRIEHNLFAAAYISHGLLAGSQGLETGISKKALRADGSGLEHDHQMATASPNIGMWPYAFSPSPVQHAANIPFASPSGTDRFSPCTVDNSSHTTKQRCHPAALSRSDSSSSVVSTSTAPRSTMQACLPNITSNAGTLPNRASYNASSKTSSAAITVPSRIGSPASNRSRGGSPSPINVRVPPVRHIVSMRQEGTPGQLWLCPGQSVVQFRTTWHVMRIASLTVTCCPPCYSSYTSGGSLGFTTERLISTRCMFHTKRAATLLVAGDQTGLLEHFKDRLTIKPCPGTKRCNAADNITWFRPTQGTVDITICGACFEDHAKANDWATRFGHVTQPVQGEWICGLAVGSIREGYIRLAPDHWDEWTRLCHRRLALPPCTSSDVKASSRKWYTVTPSITGFVICEACYLDRATTSRFVTNFVPHRVSNPNDLYMCDFSSLYFLYPFVLADHTHSWGRFQTAASRVMDCAMAQMNGAQPQFWGLPMDAAGRDTDWNVCEKCYASLFEPLGFDRFLQPPPPPLGNLRTATRQCELCPGAPLKVEHFKKLQEAANAGVFSVFADWARSVSRADVYHLHGSRRTVRA